MAKRRSGKGRAAHTGRTERGNTRDRKVDRIGGVTIYQRGKTYFLYYREDGQSKRPKVDGNLSVARATAAKVAAALEEERPSPVSFQRTTPAELVEQYLDYVEHVQCLAWRTQDRYRAALTRFREFCEATGVKRIDVVDVATVEDFVRWLRGQTRARNGHPHAAKRHYKLAGIKFILSVCKTAFNWGYRRRMLPPYASNPFSDFKPDALKSDTDVDEIDRVFTLQQQEDFFAACSDFQRSLFLPLAYLGMRTGELTHLMISDVDLTAGVVRIRSKPELRWRVKTRRRRDLPLVGELRELFEMLIAWRKAGFVVQSEPFFTGQRRPARTFQSDRELLADVASRIRSHELADADEGERGLRKQAVKLSLTMGQLPVKQVRIEFAKVTRQIGCPEFTRAHDLRHLFSSRAQELGANPLLVQQILGHASLEMTRRYTHLNAEALRPIVSLLLNTSRPTGGDAEAAGDPQSDLEQDRHVE